MGRLCSTCGTHHAATQYNMLQRSTACCNTAQRAGEGKFYSNWDTAKKAFTVQVPPARAPSLQLRPHTAHAQPHARTHTARNSAFVASRRSQLHFKDKMIGGGGIGMGGGLTPNMPPPPPPGAAFDSQARARPAHCRRRLASIRSTHACRSSSGTPVPASARRCCSLARRAVRYRSRHLEGV
jgi:hypothetical protein